MEERRKYSRAAISTKVRSLGKEDEIVLFANDISEGGIFLQWDEPPFVGTQLELEVSIPEVEDLLRFKGEVMWRLEGSGCGIQFRRVTQVQRKIIREFVAKANKS